MDAEAGDFVEQLGPDVDAAPPGAVSARAEELVDLLEELPAGGGVLVEERDLAALARRLGGGGQAGGAGADDGDVDAPHAPPPGPPARRRGVGVRSAGCATSRRAARSHTPRPSCTSTRMPSRTGVTQVRTLG